MNRLLRLLPKSLLGRVFTLYLVTLVIFVASLLALFYRYQYANEIEGERADAERLMNVAAQSIADSAVIGDYDTIGKTLEHGARRRGALAMLAAGTSANVEGQPQGLVVIWAMSEERGSSQAEISIRVEGCGNPSALKIAPVQMTTSARGGYTWSVSKRTDQDELVIGQDATATVTYTVDFTRSGAAYARRSPFFAPSSGSRARPRAVPKPTTRVMPSTPTSRCWGDSSPWQSASCA